MCRSGIKHQNADALFGRPCRQCQRPDSECDNTLVNDVMCVSQIPPVEPVLTNMIAQIQDSEPGKSIREVQLVDPIIGPILRTKEADTPPSTELTTASNHYTRQLVQQWDQLVIEDGTLYQRFESSDGTKYNLQMITPK